jgi:hypothetical protein
MLQHVFLKEHPQNASEREAVLWWVPLIYITPNNMEPHGPVIWMKDERHTNINNLPGPDSFIILNPDEIGKLPVHAYSCFPLSDEISELSVYSFS